MCPEEGQSITPCDVGPKTGTLITWSKARAEKREREEEMGFKDTALVKLTGFGGCFNTRAHGKDNEWVTMFSGL